MKQKTLLMTLMVSFLTLGIIFFGGLLTTRVKKEYVVEAGEIVSVEVFRQYDWDKGAFEWVELPDTTIVGTIQGQVYVFPITYDVILHIVDTKQPIVSVQKVDGYYNCEIYPEQFIRSIEDASFCYVRFIKNPDTTQYGLQEVHLLVTDSAGNQTEVVSQLCVINVKERVLWNLGEELPLAEVFLATAEEEISYLTDISSIDITQEGVYQINLLVDGKEMVSELQIMDIEAPEVVIEDKKTWKNKPIKAEDFVISVTDNSNNIQVRYEIEPDWTQVGEQTVTIIAEDKKGNRVKKEALLTIQKDEKAPVVTVTDIDVKVGSSVSYKKAVSYYDNIDTEEEMTLIIERSGVNLDEVGTYEVIYTVTDCSGNSTSVVGKLNVVEESFAWEEEEKIHKKAQEVLNSILTEGMTEKEKAKAIYTWIKHHIGYVNHSEKRNYMRGAYEGLFEYQGDCFVYAATAKELLTQAGILNMDIVKLTTNPSHYWNLVYIEDGWYHFDTTPRVDKSEFFLLTNAELEAYSSKHGNTHLFDASLYPEIK